MRTVLVSVLLALVFGAGCGRGVCEIREAKFEQNFIEKWVTKKDLVPPNATVCGHFSRDGQVTLEDLVIDFPDDDNPMVRIIDHLENKGFERTSQDFSNPDLLMAHLANKAGDLRLSVVVNRLKGRSYAKLAFD